MTERKSGKGEELTESDKEAGATPKISWSFRGRVEYETALELQYRIRADLQTGKGRPTLLMLEHPPVITLGHGAKQENILEERFPIFKVDRGGEATYHGPGQLVVYPILALPDFKLGIRRYVSLIENVIMEFLREYSIASEVEQTNPGVWVGGKKIAAIGINVSRNVTTHGFSINISPDLGHYRAIIACGLKDRGITSMAELIENPPELKAAAEQVAKIFMKKVAG